MLTVKMSRDQVRMVRWGEPVVGVENRVTQVTADGHEAEILLEMWNKVNGQTMTVGEIMANLIQMDPNRRMRMFWIISE